MIRVFDATAVATPALMTVPGPYGNVHVESIFVAGSTRHELAAQSELVDPMVVGSRGYGPRAAVLLGGVTHTLLRKAACPVVVLPRGSRGLEVLFAPEAKTTTT